MTKPKAYPNYWRRQEEREKRDRQAKAFREAVNESEKQREAELLIMKYQAENQLHQISKYMQGLAMNPFLSAAKTPSEIICDRKKSMTKKILGWFVAAVIASFVFLVTANVMGLQSAVIFYGVMIAISCGTLLAAKWIND